MKGQFCGRTTEFFSLPSTQGPIRPVILPTRQHSTNCGHTVEQSGQDLRDAVSLACRSKWNLCRKRITTGAMIMPRIEMSANPLNRA